MPNHTRLRFSLSYNLVLKLVLTIYQIQISCSNVQLSQDICYYFPNNTKIRHPESCNKYITCINFVSYYKDCNGLTPWFDKEKSSCVKTLPEQSLCSISCAESAGKFISDPTSCSGYFYCHDENTATRGKCPYMTHFNATKQACIYKNDSDCIVENFDFCVIVKNGINFRDEKFCNKYYTCIKNQQISKTCPNRYYDPIIGSCAEKSNVKCREHPMTSDVCGTLKRPKINYFASDGATCAGFFFCAEQENGFPDRNPQWGQCPPDKFFSVSKQACVHPLDIKCTWDRCHGRTIPFVVSGRKGCRHYLRCRDGESEQELSCGNLFFNERIGACTSQVIKDIACKA